MRYEIHSCPLDLLFVWKNGGEGLGRLLQVRRLGLVSSGNLPLEVPDIFGFIVVDKLLPQFPILEELILKYLFEKLLV